MLDTLLSEVMCTLDAKTIWSSVKLGARGFQVETYQMSEPSRQVLNKVINFRTRHRSTFIAFQRCHPQHEVDRNAEEGSIDRPTTDTRTVGESGG
jgi:hypothetical protein